LGRLKEQITIAQSEQVEHTLTEIELEYEALIHPVEKLSPAQASSRPNDAWSVIDVVVHIAAWQNNALQIAQQQAAPDAPDLDPHRGPAGILRLDVQKFNDEVWNAHRDWTLEQAMAWYTQTNANLRFLAALGTNDVSALAAPPAERLLGGSGKYGACLWYWRPAVIHSREHRHSVEQRGLIPGSIEGAHN
jgi:hypothetical protein